MLKCLFVYITAIIILSACTTGEKKIMKPEIINEIIIEAASERVKLYKADRSIVISSYNNITCVDVDKSKINWSLDIPGLYRILNVSDDFILMVQDSRQLVKIDNKGNEKWIVNNYTPLYYIPHISEGSLYIPGIRSMKLLNFENGEELKQINLKNDKLLNEVFLGIDSNKHLIQIWEDSSKINHISMIDAESEEVIWNASDFPFNINNLSNISIKLSNFIGFSVDNTRTYYLINKSDGSVALSLNYSAWFAPALLNEESLLLVNESNRLVYYSPIGKSEYWEKELNDRVFFTPAADNNSVFIPVKDEIYILSLKEGKLLGSIKLPFVINSTPVILGGRLYVVCKNGVMYTVKLTTG